MMNLGQRILGRYIPHRRETFDTSFACSHSFSEWWHIFLVAAQLGRSSCCSRSPPLFAQFCNQDISGSQLEEKRTSDPHIAYANWVLGYLAKFAEQLQTGCRVQIIFETALATSSHHWSFNHFSFNSFSERYMAVQRWLPQEKKNKDNKKWDLNIL